MPSEHKKSKKKSGGDSSRKASSFDPRIRRFPSREEMLRNGVTIDCSDSSFNYDPTYPSPKHPKPARRSSSAQAMAKRSPREPWVHYESFPIIEPPTDEEVDRFNAEQSLSSKRRKS